MKTTKTTKATKVSKSARSASRPVLPQNISGRRILKMTLIGLLVLFIAGQLWFDLTMFRRVNNGDNTAVAQLIEHAVEGLHKQAAVEPRTGTVYLTEAKLTLPATELPNDQLLYNYADFDDGKPQMQITTRQALRVAESRLWSAQTGGSVLTGPNPTAVFDKVPQLQACARGVLVLFDAQTATSYGVKPENTKQLKDGRTMYLVTDDVATCGIGLNSLVEYLKQAESY